MSSHRSKLSGLSFSQLSLQPLWQRLLCSCVLNTWVFLSFNDPPSHLLVEVVAAWWLIQRGALCLFAGVQEASVVWGQPEGGDVSTPQHQGLSEAKGRGINLLKFLCASPRVEALCCYLTFSPNGPAEKPP